MKYSLENQLKIKIEKRMKEEFGFYLHEVSTDYEDTMWHIYAGEKKTKVLYKLKWEVYNGKYSKFSTLRFGYYEQGTWYYETVTRLSGVKFISLMRKYGIFVKALSIFLNKKFKTPKDYLWVHDKEEVKNNGRQRKAL